MHNLPFLVRPPLAASPGSVSLRGLWQRFELLDDVDGNSITGYLEEAP